MKGDIPGVPDIPEWCAGLPAGARVGMDPFLHTINSARKLQQTLEKGGQTLVPVFGGNLVDAAWVDAPPAPTVRTPASRVHLCLSLTVCVLERHEQQCFPCCALRILSLLRCHCSRLPDFPPYITLECVSIALLMSNL